MGQIKVLYQPEVKESLWNLIFILYDKGYFSFLESSIDYVEQLLDFIDENIASSPTKPTPKKLIHLGSKYVFYKTNNRTTWYVLFENKGNQYLVTHITNNHTEEAGFL